MQDQKRTEVGAKVISNQVARLQQLQTGTCSINAHVLLNLPCVTNAHVLLNLLCVTILVSFPAHLGTRL